MALIGGGYRHNLTGKLFGATNLDGANPSFHVWSQHMTARGRNWTAGEAGVDPLASIPSGKRPPNVWRMAQNGGAISSFKRTNIAMNASATGEMGFPRSGSTTITIDGTASGGLIVGATGTATITIDGYAAIVASLNATGSTTITIDGNAALGAIASITGETTISIDGNSSIMALGYMTGTTIETGELTPRGIAVEVWNTLLAMHQGDGTAGKALSMAGAGGVDLEALANAVVAALEATEIPVNIKKVNDITVTGSGVPNTDPWRPA